MEPTQMKNHLLQAWLVLALATVFGAALAAVQVNLSPIVAANKLEEALARVPELVWGEAAVEKGGADNPLVEIEPGTFSVEKDGKTSYYPLFRVVRGGKLAGWVAKAQGQGYADKIEILIGLDPNAETITGLFVLEQKETPGLGNKVALAAWRKQFVGKQTGTPLLVVKGASRLPNAIDAITGATISSRSVTGIVNRTTGDLKGRLTPASSPFAERPL